ncbi:MAG: hypothetical protein ACFB51_17155 [Anaerolineae bacterium]
MAQNWIQLNDQNEGTLALVRHIHADAAGDEVSVTIQPPLLPTWERFTTLELLPWDYGGDYVVFQQSTTLREFGIEQWSYWLNQLEGQQPAAAFVFDGVMYQWLYDVNDPPAEITIYRDGWEGFVPLSWVWFLGTLGVTGAAVFQQRPAQNETPIGEGGHRGAVPGDR